ncbi:MAG: hypothetical protein JWL66_1613 [Sphingomonadales bacterium]|nr:hypothetical protein [Sphingomonadales bacterium]
MTRRIGAFARWGASLYGLWTVVAAALAQNAAPPTLADIAASEAVATRARPDYDPLGISAGGFRLFPTLQIQSGYDDNIYNINTGKVSDGLVRVSPRLEARSNWSRHSLTLSTGGQFERYFSRSSENNDQYDVGAIGRYDVSSDLAINGSGLYARRVEQRGTLGDVIASGDRIRYDQGTVRLSATNTFGRLLLIAGGTYSTFNYLPVHLAGVSLSQDYRDRKEVTALLRGDYVIGPGIRTFVSGNFNDQNYRQPLAGVDQDSTGFAVLGGVVFAINEFINGEVGIGYLKQYYRQPNLHDIGSFSYNARAIWNPTLLLTVTATAARTVQQSPFINQSGVLQDSLGVNVDYELLRNLILSVNEQFISNDYQDVDRKERLWITEGRARYLINRWLEAGLSINHRFQTTSNLLGREYAGTSILMSITLK